MYFSCTRKRGTRKESQVPVRYFFEGWRCQSWGGNTEESADFPLVIALVAHFIASTRQGARICWQVGDAFIARQVVIGVVAARCRCCISLMALIGLSPCLPSCLCAIVPDHDDNRTLKLTAAGQQTSSVLAPLSGIPARAGNKPSEKASKECYKHMYEPADWPTEYPLCWE